MENLQYSKILRANWDIVALIMSIAIVFALIISLVQPFQYAATTKILVIQKQELNADAYTATKSAERIGKNLANILFTSSFYNEVIESNNSFTSKFSQDSIERRKEWDKNVEANVTPETGILEISVYDTDKNYAAQLVRSIAYVLVTKGAEYHGGGSNVEIKIVDDVFMSKYPKRPNIILNGALALIIGFLFGSAFVVLNEAKKVKNTQILINSNEIMPANINQFVPELNPEINQNWQVAKAIDTNDFGFVAEPEQVAEEQEIVVPEEKIEEQEIVTPERKTEIITMYDHLQ